MIRSMTGFARASLDSTQGTLELELRSVNHRYLDLKLMLPDALRGWETVLRKKLRTRLHRGRIEARLRWQASGGARLSLDRELAGEIVAAARELAGETGGSTPPLADALSLLAWPGVVESASPELDALLPEFETLCDSALEELVIAREREGGALNEILSERAQTLLAGVERLQASEPAREQTIQSRLTARLEALGAEVDPERVAQEAALLVVRQDVSEELDRLRAHAVEISRLLESDEDKAVGRRLDFLVQELAREANTLASKSATLAVNREALEFKVLIEAMREQVQNVE
jgi:uncharacterized protein (TIGR00255 family)